MPGYEDTPLGREIRLRVVEGDRRAGAGEDRLNAVLGQRRTELGVAHADAQLELGDRDVGQALPFGRAQAFVVEPDDALQHMAELVVEYAPAGFGDQRVGAAVRPGGSV